MLFGTLALTIATSISGGCSALASANEVEAIASSANDVISDAEKNYDYSNFNMGYDELLSFTKQKYYSYAEDEKVMTDDQLVSLKNVIQTDSDYIEFSNIDKMFIANNVSIGTGLDGVVGFGNSIGNVIGNHTFDHIKPDGVIIGNQLGGITADKGDGGSGSSSSGIPSSNGDTYQFDFFDYDENNVSITLNGTYEETQFFGFVAHKDTCIAVYDLISNFLSNLEDYIKIVKSCWDALKTIDKSCVVATAVYAAIEAISKGLSSAWSSLCSTFTSGGPVGIVIALILAAVGTACIYLISKMYVFGYMQKGFAFGWKTKGLFNLEWVDEELDE